jgi:hypothetical protein
MDGTQHTASAAEVSLHASRRKLSIFSELALAPEALQGVASIAIVAAIGFAEAATLSRPGAARRGVFIFRYGLGQILPSIIWASKPADLICRRIKVNPKKMLEAAENTGSRAESRVYLLQTVRSIIAGFVGIAQILRLVDVASEAREAEQE